jgi:hypothetical protein
MDDHAGGPVDVWWQLSFDVDLMAMIARLRGAAVATNAKSEEPADGEDGTEGQHQGR